MNNIRNNTTLSYYNKNAQEFVRTTQKVDFHKVRDKFCAELPAGAKILDFGCGSGRDAKAFLEQGYRVTAIDGSEELCKEASAFLGQPVRRMLFQELEEQAVYDGIWACASILHLPKEELSQVLGRMQRALKSDGRMYASFKYGTFEGVRNGRYFTDFTENTWEALIREVPDLEIEEMWLTGDVREGRGDERWLNILMHKADKIS